MFIDFTDGSTFKYNALSCDNDCYGEGTFVAGPEDGTFSATVPGENGEETHNGYVNEDGDLIIPDTFHFGPGGHEKKWLPRATRAAIDTINKVAAGHDGNTKYQGGNLLSDEISESICELELNWSSTVYFYISNNQLCPPYPYL